MSMQPVVVHGWTLFAHPLFLSQVKALAKQVEALQHKDPVGYLNKNATKRLYAITKLAGEHYCRFFHDEGRVATAALRFFNVFGPRQDPGGAYAAAVPIFMEKALRGEPITIYGDGEQTRDFIYVKDIVAAARHVTLTEGLTGVRNAGYGGALTVGDLARRIVALAGSRSEIRFLPERAGDVKHSRAAVEALAGTGFQPVSSLDEGLAATLAYFRGRLGV